MAGISLISLSCQPKDDYNHAIQVGAQNLKVEVVNSREKIQKGLGGRKSMPENSGMLFNFGREISPAFWMKGMEFNLDFIWINKNKIVGITNDVPAPKIDDDRLPNYYPPSAVDSVLEVNAGWSARHNIKVGDEVQ